MLPPIKKVKNPILDLPTAWQTVIFRNYGYVRTERIAEVLGCDVATVDAEAKRLGLDYIDYSAEFESRGYITVIRNNWYLLPYGQLEQILGFDESKLDFVLEKDDFLSTKLGGFKPECDEVRYAPLNDEQIAVTESLAHTVASYRAQNPARPFDFFSDSPEQTGMVIEASGKRIVHGYLSPCGDVFVSDCSDTLPEALLEKYRESGVNGIWLHGVLSSLSPYPFVPELSRDYQLRRENLNKIIARCKKYGIKVYLYMNEPRALPAEADPKYDSLIGWKAIRTLCMEKQEVREYLYEAVRDLCASAKDLGGIFTITMSENPTHCNFAPNTDCPTCKHISPEISAATVNNIMWQAMKDSGCEGELIANLWGWSSYMGWSDEQIFHGIEMLDPDISVLCVSEYDLDIEKGGVKSRIIDYSISNPGPSETSRKMMTKAREAGHTVYAKIQASNSWECSAVPYIPVFDLVHEHLENLSAIGVEDYFLTWTQGGYPSPSVELAGEYKKGFDLDKWYEKKYGDNAEIVHDGIKRISRAFREYPFSVQALYLSPKTLGSANMWELEPEEKSSSMVCYSFDDYEAWITPYPYEVYVSQMEKLLSLWQQGIDILASARKNDSIDELLRFARASRLHFKTDLLQTRFSRAKREGDEAQMRLCVEEEKSTAAELLELMRLDARIGYEASNHYFYTERDLIEKIVRMEVLSKLLKG
ncbi:MAG: hypothetical protein IJD74_04845 [Clostridia bacterium]|nr:hypothetical protein [Clostridia bacterium]